MKSVSEENNEHYPVAKSMIKLGSTILVVIIAVSVPFGWRQERAVPARGSDALRRGLLVADTCGMETAWDIPRNPLTDSVEGSYVLATEIQSGFQLFIGSPEISTQFAVNRMTCANCHLNAGQRAKALPLLGVAAIYPEYNKRAGRLFSLEDRILECYKRSIDASPRVSDVDENGKYSSETSPTTASKEVLAIAAYITWLSEDYTTGASVPWRGQNIIPAGELIPVERLNPRRGKLLYAGKCVNCHGENGQGVEIGDKKAGPLWGPYSWNDGAGAGRVYTLAGMIRYTMPYLNPGSLTDEEAQQIAAFIDSKPRPVYPFKENDYPNGGIPPDAVYYKR